MSQWLCVLWRCSECGNEFDSIEKRADLPETKACHALLGMQEDNEVTCDGMAVRAPAVAPPKVINRKNSDFAAREKTRLTRRGNDHWKRQGLDEAMDRTRAWSKKNDG